MGKHAVRAGDRIEGSDMLTVLRPVGTTEVAAPEPCSFEGSLSGGLSNTIRINGKRAATTGSTANLTHTPPPGARLQTEPNKEGAIRSGSSTVNINGKPAARAGDLALTRNATLEGTVTATPKGTVRIGG